VERLLARIDGSVDVDGTQPEAWPAPLAFQPSPAALDLGANGIRTVIWATGFKRDYSWLRVPVVDAAGEIVHRGGITPAPGLYVTGLRFLRRWNPAFIDAVSADASELAVEIQRYFHETSRAAA
jgi:putative flavoprotein involved in K+ transport